MIMLLLFISIILALLISWHFVGTKKSGGGGRNNLPPSPPTLPIIGNLHLLGQLPHRSLRDLSRKYGPLMLLRLGSKPALVVSSAGAAKEILKTHDLAFAERPDLLHQKKIFYENKGLAHLPYGDGWRKLKSIFMQELLSVSRVKSFTSIMEEETSLLVGRISDCSMSSRPVNLTDMFASLTFDMISRAAFGERHGGTERGRKLLRVLEEIVGLLSRFTPGEFIPWLGWINRVNGYNAALDGCTMAKDEIMDAVIGDHLNRGVENLNNVGDFVNILLESHKGGTPGVSLDLETVKAAILDIFGAGTETSASALAWAMAELIRHPPAMKKLQNEVREIMREKDRITEDDLQKMHYLKAVIKEALRLHPPLAIYFHMAREYVNVAGFDIAPKTWIMINVWAIGRDPAFWVEPEEFMPERFLDSSVDFRGLDFQFIPFGAGRRICPGIGFAVTSMEHILANLMHKFDWGLPDGAKGVDLDEIGKPGVVIMKTLQKSYPYSNKHCSCNKS